MDQIRWGSLVFGLVLEQTIARSAVSGAPGASLLLAILTSSPRAIVSNQGVCFIARRTDSTVVVSALTY